jgi:MFS transporter, CP family, cyanate transporter
VTDEVGRPDVHAARSGVAGPTTLLLLVTVIVTALNLRSAVTSLGPLLRDLQADLGMSDTVAGVLTTLPVVCFGVVGLTAGRIGRRIGTEQALAASVAMITVGIAVRSASPTVGWLLVTTLVAVFGSAVANVLVPVVVKAWFPGDVGRVTGWYSTAVVLGGSLPAALAVPVAELFGGWRGGLAFWAVPAGLALVPWFLVARGRRAAIDPPPQPAPVRPIRPVHHRAQAWALMVFFGIQSLEAYVAVGWLAAILRDAGLSPSRAGLLLAVAMGLGAPVALVLPRLAARRPDQRVWVVVVVVASAGAYLGLWLAPAAAPTLWAVLLGIGLGAFPLALVMIGLRAATPRGTSDLSSLVQGVGYLLAVAGPLAVGVLHDVTGAWDVPLMLLLAVLVPKLAAGLLAAKPGLVDQ